MEIQNKRSYNGKIMAVILDWAGTVVDYGSFAPAEVFIRLFDEKGIKISAEDARSGMGLMKKDHLKKILSIPWINAQWNEIFGSLPSDLDIDHLFDEFIPLQMDVIKDFSDPIPGLFEAINELRKHNILIGSDTGYIRSMMNVLAPEVAKKGFTPDCLICSDDVPVGRPAPWMCFANMMALDVYPAESCIKVGDTIPDIHEGLNAGMWSVGLAQTSSMLGLLPSEIKALPMTEKQEKVQIVTDSLYQAGAHIVIDGIWDLPEVIETINSSLSQGLLP